MILIAYGLACLLFYLAFKRLRVVGHTSALLKLFQSAAQVMSDKGLTDLEKETRIRAASIQSGKATLMLVLRLAAVPALAAVPVLVALQAGLFSLDDFVAFSLEPLVLVITVVVLVALDKALARFPGRSDG